MTICANCKHCRPQMKHPIVKDRWQFAECLASLKRAAGNSTNKVSGEVTSWDDEYELCSFVNDGECPKFEAADSPLRAVGGEVTDGSTTA